MLPGGPLPSLIRRRYAGATTGERGPTSATLVPPAEDPPLGASVKSQALPAASAAKPIGPAAACASARLGKFSNRQYSPGLPAGNAATFFSARTLSARDPAGRPCCATAAGDNRDVTKIKTATTRPRRLSIA